MNMAEQILVDGFINKLNQSGGVGYFKFNRYPNCNNYPAFTDSNRHILKISTKGKRLVLFDKIWDCAEGPIELIRCLDSEATKSDFLKEEIESIRKNVSNISMIKELENEIAMAEVKILELQSKEKKRLEKVKDLERKLMKLSV